MAAEAGSCILQSPKPGADFTNPKNDGYACLGPHILPAESSPDSKSTRNWILLYDTMREYKFVYRLTSRKAVPYEQRRCRNAASTPPVADELPKLPNTGSRYTKSQ
jgi:hypothetical protein